MPRKYYDCPCCEREVWVHSFWGAAFVGSICIACRDDHGNYKTSNCSVNGPAKRRRDQAKRDEAYERAKRDAERYEAERQRLLEERKQAEEERMARLAREREEARKEEAERLRIEREKAAAEREAMKQKLAKEAQDKLKAAEEIRKKIAAKQNPYKDFKKLETKKFIQDIGDRVIEFGAAAEALEGKIDELKGSMKKTLDTEFDIVKDEFVEYKKYVNGIKDLTGNFITTFGGLFDDAKKNVKNAFDDAQDLADSDNDEDEKKEFKESMTENVTKLCDAVHAMIGEVAVIESYYDYMLKDCEYFNEFARKYADEYEDEQKDMDPAIKALLDMANELIKDQRSLADANDPDFDKLCKTKFYADYETKSYIRDCNSVTGLMWNTTKDYTKMAASGVADVCTFGQFGLLSKCMKKIEDEKYAKTTETVEYEIEEKFYDGAEHKKVLQRFTTETLQTIQGPLDKVVKKYKSVYGESNKKTEEINNFKKRNILALKQKLQSFKTAADELKQKMDSGDTLSESRCNLMQKKWNAMLYGDGKNDVGIYGLIEQMKKDQENMKDMTDID